MSRSLRPVSYRRLLCLGIPVTAGLLLMGASSGGAATTVSSGWWTANNPGGATESLFNTVPPDPDVMAGQELVQGGATTPTAYSAVVFYLDPGATAHTLTLQVATDSASSPLANVMVCPLTGTAITTEQGGPIANAPAYSSTGCVTSAVATNAYTFDVSKLATAGVLALAVLPVTTTDRVVLVDPTVSALSLGAAAPVAAADPPTPAPSDAATPESSPTAIASEDAAPQATLTVPAAAPVGNPVTPTVVASTVPPPAALAPAPAAAPGTSVDAPAALPVVASADPTAATTQVAAPTTVTAPVTTQPVTNAAAISPAAVSDDSGRWLAALVVGLIVLSGAGWGFAGRQASASTVADGSSTSGIDRESQ